MKKTLSLVLALVMAVTLFAFTGCNKKTVNDDSTFVVGFDAEFPPYGYKDESGEYVGFDLDLAQEVCKRNSWEYKAQPIDWDSKDMELNSGTIDCIWNGFTMTGREDEYTWSDAYVDNTQVVVVKADSGIVNLAGLAGKNVAVQTDSSAQSVLEEDQKAVADTFAFLDVEKDYITCFNNLDAGAVDAVAMDIGVANYQIQSRGAEKYIIVPEQLSSEQYAVGFKKGNTELCEKVQATLDDMMKDGTFQQIAEKWGLSGTVIIKQ